MDAVAEFLRSAFRRFIIASILLTGLFSYLYFFQQMTPRDSMIYAGRKLAEWNLPLISPLFKSALDDATDRIVTVYKWQDSSGEWQYGMKPAAGARNIQALEVDRETNVLPSTDGTAVPRNGETEGGFSEEFIKKIYGDD